MKQAKLLSTQEFKRVLAVIDAHRYSARNKAIFHLSFLGGMRAIEIASLKFSDVVDENYKVKTQIILTANMTKGSARNRVIVSTKLQKALKRYVDAVRALKPLNAPFITSQKGGHFSPLTIVQLFAKFYEKAGIYGASSHSGRRNFVTSLCSNQINLRVVQILARHSSVNTTMLYADFDDFKLQKAVEAASI